MEKKRDEHVQSRAYELWEKDGRPHGKNMEHWTQAEKELAMNSPAAEAKSPPAKGEKTAKPRTPKGSAPKK